MPPLPRGAPCRGTSASRLVLVSGMREYCKVSTWRNTARSSHVRNRVSLPRLPQGATQSYARTLDRSIRINPLRFLRSDGASATRLHAMVETACKLLSEGAPVTPAEQLHRLAKVDTRPGGPWMPSLAATGVSYAMLLYERFLGRPFAGHRDSVSEMIGDIVESEVEGVLTSAGISFRKTKRAEKVPGFDQAPDFIVPSAENPKVVIEAKLTEDDGTARDK